MLIWESTLEHRLPLNTCVSFVNVTYYSISVGFEFLMANCGATTQNTAIILFCLIYYLSHKTRTEETLVDKGVDGRIMNVKMYLQNHGVTVSTTLNLLKTGSIVGFL